MGALMGEKVKIGTPFTSKADEKEFIKWINKNRPTLSALTKMKPGQVIFYALFVSWYNDRIQAATEERAGIYEQGKTQALRLLETLPDALRVATEAGIMAGLLAAGPAIKISAERNAALEKGRPLGRAKIKNKVAVRDKAIEDYGLNYFKRYPGADNDQCANEMRIMLEKDQKRYGPLLSHSRIVRKLSGVKKRALA
jgi:hypothetical protein